MELDVLSPSIFCTAFPPIFREGCGSEQIPVGASDLKKPSTDNVEWFLSMIQFENKGKLGELSDLDLAL